MGCVSMEFISPSKEKKNYMAKIQFYFRLIVEVIVFLIHVPPKQNFIHVIDCNAYSKY